MVNCSQSDVQQQRIYYNVKQYVKHSHCSVKIGKATKTKRMYRHSVHSVDSCIQICVWKLLTVWNAFNVNKMLWCQTIENGLNRSGFLIEDFSVLWEKENLQDNKECVQSCIQLYCQNQKFSKVLNEVGEFVEYILKINCFPLSINFPQGLLCRVKWCINKECTCTCVSEYTECTEQAQIQQHSQLFKHKQLPTGRYNNSRTIYTTE